MLSISNLMVATERMLKISVQAGSERVRSVSLYRQRPRGMCANDPPPTRSTSRGSQAHLVPGPCHALLLTPCTPGRAGACIEKKMRGGWWTESPHPTALACWPAFQPHSLVVLGGSQGAGHTSCFHWATDQVLLSGRQQGSATDDTLQEPNCVPGLPQLLPLRPLSQV